MDQSRCCSCDVCGFRCKRCPPDCLFDLVPGDSNSAYCENNECKYYDSDKECDFALKCGAYLGNLRSSLYTSSLEFEEEED